jgi:quinol monooxygenase YgiN
MIRVTGRLICATEGEAGIVRAMLPEHIRLSRAELGCLTFDVSPYADPLVWVLDESFLYRSAFEVHQARTRASAWFTATRQLKRNFRVEEIGS